MSDDDVNSKSIFRNVWFVSISSSIAASIVFLVFFQPVILIANRIFLGLLGSIGDSITNSAYTQAAMGIERGLIGMFSVMAFSLPIAISILPVVFSFFKRRIKLFEESDIEQTPRRNFVMIIAQIICFTLSVALAGMTFVSIQAATTLDGYIRASAPYISHEQQEIFVARWATMDSREDYDELLADIEDLSEDGEWALPERRI